MEVAPPRRATRARSKREARFSASRTTIASRSATGSSIWSSGSGTAARPPDGSDLAFAPSNNLGCTKAAFEATPFDESYPDAAGEDREWCARLTAGGYVLRAEPGARMIHHQELTLVRFLRQQARYGRGAYRFRLRGGAPRPLESPAFYWSFLQGAFAESLAVGLLVSVAQAVTAVGFASAWAAERARWPRLKRSRRSGSSLRDGS